MHMRRLNNQGARFPSKAKSGMTLVEVSVALAIATLVIGGIINGYNYCTFIQYSVLARVAPKHGGPPIDADGT